MKTFFSIILALAVPISTALAKHDGQRKHGKHQGKHGKDFSSFSRSESKFSRGASGKYRNWGAETGKWVIGAAIGRVAVTGTAAADSSLWRRLSVITGIGTHMGAGAILTRTTAIILRIGTLTTVAPYQDSDSMGPDPSWFPAPASPGNCADRIPAVKKPLWLFEIARALVRFDHVAARSCEAG